MRTNDYSPRFGGLVVDFYRPQGGKTVSLRNEAKLYPAGYDFDEKAFKLADDEVLIRRFHQQVEGPPDVVRYRSPAVGAAARELAKPVSNATILGKHIPAQIERAFSTPPRELSAKANQLGERVPPDAMRREATRQPLDADHANALYQKLHPFAKALATNANTLKLVLD